MTEIAPPPVPVEQKWQVGVCCDAGDQVEQCLDGLERSGWIDSVRLFLTPGANVPKRYGHLPVTCLPGDLQWAARDLLMIGELLMRAPEVEAYLLIRADAVVARSDCRQALEGILWPDREPGVLLLERGDRKTRGGWSRVVTHPDQAPRALAIAKEAARRFLTDRNVLDVAASKANGSPVPWATLSAWALAAGVPVHFPNANLVHTSNAAEMTPCPDSAGIRVHGIEVSTIVPTWNCGPYLPPCLHSLLNQSVAAEVIVVDDASDDETPEILARFADRIRVIRHDERRGANAARNTGLRCATGDFVVMADADNQYSPQWLEKLLEAVLSDPQSGLAYCGFLRLSEDGSKRAFASHPWNPRELWYDNYIDMPSLVRREALPREGLVEGFRPFDDWRLWLDMATRGWKGKHVCENLYVKRVRRDSKTLRSKSVPDERAREVALVRRDFAHLVGLDSPLAVVIPAHGCEDLTTRCLTHLADFSGVPFVVYYVDNGSPISVLDTIARTAEERNVSLRILRNSENRGFTEAVNQGIEASAAANVLLLNNDCFVGPNCVENLAYPMATREHVAAIGPVTCDRGGQSLRIPSHRFQARVGDEILDLLADPVRTAAELRQRHKTCERELLAFFCTLLNREALRRFGSLDHRFPSGLAADDEWCLRVRGHGWKTLLSYGAYAAHMHRTTFERFDIDRDALQRESKHVLGQVLAEKQGNASY